MLRHQREDGNRAQQQGERQQHTDRRGWSACSGSACASRRRLLALGSLRIVGQHGLGGALGQSSHDQRGGVGCDQHADGCQGERVGLPG